MYRININDPLSAWSLKLVSVRVTDNKPETTSRYFISSWQASAQDFMVAIRDHWQIENGLHWVLDIAFREDDSRIRKDHAPHNMPVLRHLALNLLKQETSSEVGIAAKRKMAGWDNDYLLKVVPKETICDCPNFGILYLLMAQLEKAFPACTLLIKIKHFLELTRAALMLSRRQCDTHK